MSKPKDKILSALEEIRDLVEKNCGETKEAVREAVVETIATLSPHLMANKPATFANAITNPNTNANFTQPPVVVPTIIEKPKTTNAVCPGGPATWNQFQKMYKETHADELKGIPYSEVRKIISSAYRQTACGPSIEAKLKTRRAVKTIKPPINGNTTVPSVKKTRGRKPKTLAPVIQTLPNVRNNKQNAQRMIQEEVPEIAENINNFRRGSNNANQTRRVRIMGPNNSQARTPGRNSPTLSSANTLQSQNNLNKPLNANKTLQFNNKPLNANKTLQFNNTATPLNANKKSKMNYEGPVENNGTRKVRVNGKRYFYWENNEGKHLLERFNNNSPGEEVGFYNENAPGYFRPAI